MLSEQKSVAMVLSSVAMDQGYAAPLALGRTPRVEPEGTFGDGKVH